MKPLIDYNLILRMKLLHCNCSDFPLSFFRTPIQLNFIDLLMCFLLEAQPFILQQQESILNHVLTLKDVILHKMNFRIPVHKL